MTKLNHMDEISGRVPTFVRADCVEHTDEALLRNHLLLSTVVAMLTIYSSISLMFPTSSCVVPLKYMVSSKKIPVCTSRDNYILH